MTNIHSADASFLGYYYQGMYALVKLLDAEDFDKISIETEDDVFLSGKSKTLYQLKHSLNSKGNLTEKNEGLWKTIRIWSDKLNNSETNESIYFIFVTPLGIKRSSLLIDFTFEKNNRSKLVKLLYMEATRVRNEREDAKLKGKIPLPHQTRAEGCNAFLSLSDTQRTELVNKITIHPNSFNLKQINSEVEKRIKNAIPIKIRKLLIERIIEWWDRRVVLGLLNEAEREIQKSELTQQIYNIYSQFQEDSLPDDYSDKDEEVDVEQEMRGMMEYQIDLVNGGTHRKKRAAIARWQAINQRDKWISQDVIHSAELNKLDKQLIKVWEDSFEPMRNDLFSENEETLCKEGCKLLDWSHQKAHLEIVPIRNSWKQPFLVQGTYQHLSDELKVGWHPNYIDRLTRKIEEEGI
ncbi:ABC-three component system protein [Exiguobacterium sp. s5]|uniref:ABC-three component system protein n=1 Tax=Exiguobacterium sp. s5 TaxID=2751239 RepID=UPI001BE695E7|nr:ABC-three component system protein [Exiguobacterium sp. s5]